MSYPAVPSSVAKVRSNVAAVAEAHGASCRSVEAIRLAVSEAVTNTVLHAYPGRAGPVHITATVLLEQLLVVVADEGGGIDPDNDSPGLGFGLGLIAAYSDRCSLATPSHGGVQVEMRFDLQSPDAAPRAISDRVASSFLN
jgi:anti-sigma regulatory factor (Ser/Thr protein kinase)